MEKECHENKNWHQVQRNNKISRSLFLDRTAYWWKCISRKGINSAFVYGYRLRGWKNAKFYVTNTTGSRRARKQGQARSYIYLPRTACAGCLWETARVRDLSFHAHQQHWVQTTISSVVYEQLRPAWSGLTFRPRSVMSSFVWLRRQIKSSAAEDFKQIISSCSRLNAAQQRILSLLVKCCVVLFFGGRGGALSVGKYHDRVFSFPSASKCLTGFLWAWLVLTGC